MADEDFGPTATYADVRDIAKLDSDDVPDPTLDRHLAKALREVEGLLHTNFDKDNTPSFTDTVFNSRDLFEGLSGSILYFTSFKDYRYIQSITEVNYRTSDSDGYNELTEGMNGDFNTDFNIDAIKFHSFLNCLGMNNVQVSGTYGFKTEDMEEWMSDMIALIAAIMGIAYVSGGSYQDVKTVSFGQVSIARGQYATNLNTQYKIVVKQLEDLANAHGIVLTRKSARQA